MDTPALSNSVCYLYNSGYFSLAFSGSEVPTTTTTTSTTSTTTTAPTTTTTTTTTTTSTTTTTTTAAGVDQLRAQLTASLTAYNSATINDWVKTMFRLVLTRRHYFFFSLGFFTAIFLPVFLASALAIAIPLAVYANSFFPTFGIILHPCL